MGRVGWQEATTAAAISVRDAVRLLQLGESALPAATAYHSHHHLLQDPIVYPFDCPGPSYLICLSKEEPIQFACTPPTARLGSSSEPTSSRLMLSVTLSHAFPHLFCYFAFLITFRFDTDSFTASFMDVYSITSTLTHTQSLTILPPKSNSTNYRGNTLCLRQLSPTSNHLFATTRGFDTTHKRYLTVFHVLPSGLLDADEETIETNRRAIVLTMTYDE